MPVKSKKSVCVIGAGAAGLCAARNCAKIANVSVTVFEQGSKCGGTWVYDPDPVNSSTASSMYESLITNLPKEVMAFRDFPFESFSPESFVTHQEVLHYLEQYAKPVASLIQYNKRVISVEPISEEYFTSPRVAGEDVTVSKPKILWKVGVESLSNDTEKRQFYYFDSVFVCNGHLSVPKYPPFAKKYHKWSIHSHYYRKPDVFTGKTVAVIGAGPSGCDIAAQLVGHASEVVVLHREKPKLYPFGKINNPGIKVTGLLDADSDSLLLVEGRRHFDCVIYCTGYEYTFPFISHINNSNSAIVNNSKSELKVTHCNAKLLNEKIEFEKCVAEAKDEEPQPLIRLEAEGQVIRPLFAHVAHAKYLNSLFFIGLPYFTIPFVLFEQQIHFAISLMLGRIPNAFIKMDEIERYEEQLSKELKEEGSPHQCWHKLGDKQWPHYEWLWNSYTTGAKSESGCDEMYASLRVPGVLRKIYEHCAEERCRDVEKYHKIRYRIIDDENFEAIYPADYPAPIVGSN